MKFNLKNRPRNFEIDGCLFTEDIDELKKWFEEFEKELREMLKDPRIGYSDKGIEVIEEVLGDA